MPMTTSGHQLLSIAHGLINGQSGLKAGAKFSLADIQFAHILFRYYDIPIVRKKLDAVEEYFDRIKQRTAYQQHVAISYAELADTK